MGSLLQNECCFAGRERLTFAERIHADRLRQGDLEQYYRRYGRALTTGADGIVSLTLRNRCPRLLARHGRLRGHLYVFDRPEPDVSTTEHRFELEPERSIVVQVVGADGHPAPGAAIDAAFGASHGGTYYASGREATATIHRPLDSSDANDEWRMLRLGVPILGATMPPVVVDMKEPPEQPVRIVLPATGSMVVRVAGEPGAARLWLHHLLLATEGAAKKGMRPRDEYAVGELAFGQVLPDGGFLFPCVALGGRFRVVPPTPYTPHPAFPMRPGGLDPGTFLGPKAVGESVEVDLLGDAQAPVVRGRLVRADGRAWSDRQIEFDLGVLVVDARDCRPFFHIRTDSLGRFALPLPRYAVGQSAGTRTFRVLDGYGIRSGPFATVKLPTLVAGEIDLGAVIAERPPRVVTAYLRKADGTLHRGLCQLEVWDDDLLSGPKWAVVIPEHVETAADGATVFYAPPRPGRWRLVSGNHPRMAVDFEFGAVGVEVVCHQ